MVIFQIPTEKNNRQKVNNNYEINILKKTEIFAWIVYWSLTLYLLHNLLYLFVCPG